MVPGFVEEGWELSQGLSEFDNVDPNKFLNAIGPLDERRFMGGATEGGGYGWCHRRGYTCFGGRCGFTLANENKGYNTSEGEDTSEGECHSATDNCLAVKTHTTNLVTDNKSAIEHPPQKGYSTKITHTK